MNHKIKILIIRFSSFGDIVQCLSIINGIIKRFPKSEIHWVTRDDLMGIPAIHPGIFKVWGFVRQDGFFGLFKLAFSLRNERFDYIYDAHSNIRSRILSFVLSFSFRRVNFIRRGKDRLKRIMLFKFGKNMFPDPFCGMISYQKPLEKWDIKKNCDFKFKPDFSSTAVQHVMEKISSIKRPFITLVPSAAWEMKRWPVEFWKKLILLMPEYQFLVLGGGNDLFCQKLKEVSPDFVFNMAGKFNLIESCFAITKSDIVVSADTGLLHVADIFGIKTIALIGPTAFGFPTGDSVEVLQTDMDCRPCTKDGRGKCRSEIYQECMKKITPEMVVEIILNWRIII